MVRAPSTDTRRVYNSGAMTVSIACAIEVTIIITTVQFVRDLNTFIIFFYIY